MAKHRRSRTHLSAAQMRSLALGQGADPAQVLSLASPSQRHRIARRAHREGTTIAGWIQGGPNILRPRMIGGKHGLLAEAKRNVQTAYAPGMQELSGREARVHAIADRQRQDEESFRSWEAGQRAQLEGTALTAESALRSSMRDLATQNADRGAAEATAAGQAVQGRSGVSDVTSHAAGAVNLAPEQQRSQQLLAAQQTGALESLGRNQAMRAALTANAAAASGARRSKISADEWSSMADIGGERDKLVLSQAADSTKEFARLMDTEISKAQSTRDYQAAAQKLGLEGAKVKIQQGELKRKSRKDRIDAELKRLDLKLKGKDLTRKERADAEAKRKNLADEYLKKYGIDVGAKSKKYSTDHGGGKGGSGAKGTAGTAGHAQATFEKYVNAIDNHQHIASGGDPLLFKAAQHRRGYGPALSSREKRQLRRRYGYVPPSGKYLPFTPNKGGGKRGARP